MQQNVSSFLDICVLIDSDKILPIKTIILVLLSQRVNIIDVSVFLILLELSNTTSVFKKRPKE